MIKKITSLDENQLKAFLAIVSLIMSLFWVLMNVPKVSADIIAIGDPGSEEIVIGYGNQPDIFFSGNQPQEISGGEGIGGGKKEPTGELIPGIPNKYLWLCLIIFLILLLLLIILIILIWYDRKKNKRYNY